MTIIVKCNNDFSIDYTSIQVFVNILNDVDNKIWFCCTRVISYAWCDQIWLPKFFFRTRWKYFLIYTTRQYSDISNTFSKLKGIVRKNEFYETCSFSHKIACKALQFSRIFESIEDIIFWKGLCLHRMICILLHLMVGYDITIIFLNRLISIWAYLALK